MRRRSAGLAIGLAVLALVAPVTVASAAAPVSGVQAQINQQLQQYPGGVQTSPNEVSYDNGNVVMVFPDASGQLPTDSTSRPELASSGSATTAAVTASTSNYGCPTGTFVNWYCFYQNINFNHYNSDGGRMLEFRDCASGGLYQTFVNYGFNDQTSSWINTVSSTDVDVYNNTGPSGYLWNELGVSRAAYVGDANNDKASAFLSYC